MSNKFCIYLGSRRGGSRKKNSNILGFSCSTFCWFLIFGCQRSKIDFYRTKVALSIISFSEVTKLCKCCYIYRRWFTNWFFLLQTLLYFVLKNAELALVIAWIRVQLTINLISGNNGASQFSEPFGRGKFSFLSYHRLHLSLIPWETMHLLVNHQFIPILTQPKRISLE